MSGGELTNHNDHYIRDFIESIESLIRNNDNTDVNEYGERLGYGFPPEVISKFKESIPILKRAYIYVHRIDYLVSGDDGEDNFLERLKEELWEISTKKVETEIEEETAWCGICGRTMTQVRPGSYQCDNINCEDIGRYHRNNCTKEECKLGMNNCPVKYEVTK